MAKRDGKKRLGKKHRQASTRPKKGRAPKVAPTTGAVDPRKRKVISTKSAEAEKASRITKQSPEKEKRRVIRPDTPTKGPAGDRPKSGRPADGIVGRQTPRSENVRGRSGSQKTTGVIWSCWPRKWSPIPRVPRQGTPLIAVCGRPNVGKRTLFNRVTGSRRSIVGDEPGITRDRIYGEIEWMGRDGADRRYGRRGSG